MSWCEGTDRRFISLQNDRTDLWGISFTDKSTFITVVTWNIRSTLGTSEGVIWTIEQWLTNVLFLGEGNLLLLHIISRLTI